MNKTLENYLTRNGQYKTREKTDMFFPFATSFEYFGIMDEMANFIQENQLKDKTMWKTFVQQFRTDVDTATRAWRGEYWGKMMRGSCITYQYTKDEELFDILKESVIDMLTTQDELGRYSTYSIEGEFNGWDIWSRKYVILGFLHFHEINPDDALNEQIIESVKKHVNYIISKIGAEEGKTKITQTSWNWGAINSSSILEPVIRLYNATGEKRYLDFATYIVDEGGSRDGNIFELAYENKLLPYQFPVVKAYEMMSCFEGLLEYYRVTGIEKWKTAAINYAKGVIKSDVTIAGSSGCTHELFDNSSVAQTLTSIRGRMQETCVTVTWMKYCLQLLCITGDIEFAEEIEKSIYNALYGSVNTEKAPKNGGMMFDSYSPLLNFKRGTAIGGLQTLAGVGFFGCCAAIGAAGTGLAPLYTMLLSKDGVVFNSYADGCIDTVTPKNQMLSFEIETKYPAEDNVDITLYLEEKEKFEIKFRIPSFADAAVLKINGKEIEVEPGKYASILDTWENGDKISLSLTVTPKIIYAKEHPEDKNASKHIAIKRGALVLARDKSLTADVGEVFDFNEKIFLKKIDSIDLDAQCQYIVSTDKGYATIMVDYASAGKSFDFDTEMECWFPTEKFDSEFEVI